MDFQNAFSNVNYGMAVDAANQKQNNFLNSLAQGIAIAEKRAQRDELMRQQELTRETEAAQMAEGTRRWEAEMALKRQAMDQRNQGFDLKKMAAQSLMQEGIAAGLTPEQAAAAAYAKMNPITFTDPLTQEVKVAPRYSIDAQQQAPAQQMDRSMLQGAIDYMQPQPQAAQQQAPSQLPDFLAGSPLKGTARGAIMEAEAQRELAFERMRSQKELSNKKPKAQKALLDSFAKVENINNTIDNAIENVTPFTAGIGSYTSLIAGTPAKDLQSTLKTIQADAAFGTLQTMRENSPTGGALGSVSERELSLLGAAQTALDQDQSPEQLRQNLINYKEQRKSSLRNVAEAYKKDFGELPESLQNKLGTTEKQSIKDKYGLK